MARYHKTARITALLLALFLLAACTATPAAQPTTAPAASSAPASAPTAAPAVTPVPTAAAGVPTAPPLDMKWKGKISNAPYSGGPPEKDVVTPYLVEKLKEYGYDIEYEFVYLERTQYAELLNLKLASGDAPDIFYNGSAAVQADYYEQGLVHGWTEEFFRQHAPEVARMFDEGGPNGMTKGLEKRTWQMTKASDGKMITIPIIYFEQNILKDIMYNNLWIEKLGVDPAGLPKNLDEFEALMTRFKTEDPDGDGKANTYGFSDSMFPVIHGAYGTQRGLWLKGSDGKLVHGDVKPGMKDALAKLAEYYQKGLIDPEFITGENNGSGAWSISHALVNGRIGVTHIAGFHHYSTNADYQDAIPGKTDADAAAIAEMKKVQGENARVKCGPALIGPDGDVGVIFNAACASPNTLYNAKMDEDKLAACLGIMNVFAIDLDMAISARYGLPGEDWKYTSEGPHPTADLFSGMSVGSSKGGSVMRNLYGPADVLNDESFRISEETNAQIAVVKKLHYSAPNMRAGYVNELYASLDEVNKYRPDLDTYASELFVKIIRGESPIDAYDAFVDYWYSNGGREMTDAVNKWYDTVK